MARRCRAYTLVEVVVAVAVLAMGVISAMGLAGMAKNRIDKARRLWQNQHMLSQAAEYIFLAGPDSDVPREVFPYDGVSVSCSVGPPENLPDSVPSENQQWRLSAIKIEVSGRRGEKVASVVVEKLTRDDKP